MLKGIKMEKKLFNLGCWTFSDQRQTEIQTDNKK